MELKPNDLHLMFDESARSLKVFRADHSLAYACEARNSTVNNGTYAHHGNAPPGSFILGRPVAKHSPAFGFWFIPVSDYNGHTAMHDWGRAGIGLHGGGSGLENPYAARQGWWVTEGCIRLLNEDLSHVVILVNDCQEKGGRCYLTVSA